MILRYAGLWAISFVRISAVDALWHFGIWGKIYRRVLHRLGGQAPEARVN